MVLTEVPDIAQVVIASAFHRVFKASLGGGTLLHLLVYPDEVADLSRTPARGAAQDAGAAVPWPSRCRAAAWSTHGSSVEGTHRWFVGCCGAAWVPLAQSPRRTRARRLGTGSLASGVGVAGPGKRRQHGWLTGRPPVAVPGGTVGVMSRRFPVPDALHRWQSQRTLKRPLSVAEAAGWLPALPAGLGLGLVADSREGGCR